MENERKHMWKWIQPTQDQILPRLRDCFELNMCERERENMCSVAHGEIVFLRAENERLKESIAELIRVWEGPRERAAVGFAAAIVNARKALST